MNDLGYELDIKHLIKNNFVTFDSFRQGIFYYIIRDYQRKDIHDDFYSYYQEPIMDQGEQGRYNSFMFPVPLDDIGTGAMLSRDKAITYMRWIRKSINDGTFLKR